MRHPYPPNSAAEPPILVAEPPILCAGLPIGPGETWITKPDERL